MELTKRTAIIINILMVIANAAWGIYCWHQNSNPLALSINMFSTGFLSAMTVDTILK